jgi:hypothetical protein
VQTLAVSVLVFCVLSQAQVAGRQDRPAPSSPARGISPDGWEIEGYGGIGLTGMPRTGSSALPSPGAPLTTSSPIFPSRQTSSWFFGDGAILLNDVNAEFGVTSRITPLDTALDSLGLADAGAAAFGIRVRKGLTSRLSAELGLDVMTGSPQLTDELLAAVESSRTSFETAISSLLSTGPFVGTIVQASGTGIGGSSREIAATGAIHYVLTAHRRFVPYATFGAGLISRTGNLPSATLEGRYRSSVLGVVPIDESDRVTIRYEQTPAFVAVFGGGVRRAISNRWGFRIDGRVLAGGTTSRLLLDAVPSVARGAPAGFIESFSNPSIQFSNDPSTGRQSTLGGPPVQDFAAFTGGGLQTRFLVTLGIYTRF